ncbi:GDYXXLXY domain-containing protein [Hymenobacter jejuensis]|uniref:GDYXXLXY domain-containing protein n=1 Tax=Hymenobacter jejuensis TaxID=2502781 RepID=A0A5B8A2G6_9BACT|nr:GDYXXLXY domain-containing protein [Hymenobacter jejuensis]QDA60392.1 GDYXXLXY domain-containing protein [Hymenobacter jejuensis]
MPEPQPLPHRQRWLLLTLLAQVLFIVAVAGAGYATMAYGRTITLRTTPVDPRDLMYGDHLVLNYTISRLPLNLWSEPTRPRRGTPVYVVLRPVGEAYEAVRVVAKEPAVPAEQVVLRGWVADNWRRGLRLRYGLEKYYVPEGVGKQLEKQATRHPMLVHISIAPWGQARITEAQVIK